MKNINQLEKQRIEILNNMLPEEIIKLYENLSEEMVSYYWSYKNNFSGNPEGIKRIDKRFQELDKELKHRYKTELLKYNSMFFSLAKEFDETNEEFYNYKVTNHYFIELLGFIHYSNLFKLLLWLVESRFNRFYIKYEFKYAFGYSYKLKEYIIEKFNLDFDNEEDFKIISDLDEKSEEIDRQEQEKRFKKIEKDFNFYIEHLVSIIEDILKTVKESEYLDLDIEITEDTIEDVTPILESFKELQEEYKTLLDEYEEFKLNPFKKAIEVSVKSEIRIDEEEYEHIKERFEKGLFNEDPDEDEEEPVTIENFNFLIKDYDEELAKALDNAPKYDFEKFELIEPEED